jgi:tetratricopeptide (TPR) repeat protein
VGSEDLLFFARIDRFSQLGRTGRTAEAEVMWQALDPAREDWEQRPQLSCEAEALYAEFQFRQGRLSEDLLVHAEQMSRSGRSGRTVRILHAVRGRWQLERGEWALAAESLHEAIRMTHEAGASDASLETDLALAQFRLGELPAARQEALRLANEPNPAHMALAQLWHAIGDPGQAAEHAQAAYQAAWGDGAPFVDAYELDRATAMLARLGVAIPELPPYDAPSDQPFPFEAGVRELIRKLRAEQAAGEQP